MIGLDEAIEWAFGRFNDHLPHRTCPVEVGAVFWQGRAGSVKVGRPVRGISSEAVSPYTLADSMRFTKAFARDRQILLGDYHCHVRHSSSWLSHFPSPRDLSDFSCLFDLYEFDPPLPDLDSIPVAPGFQLIQSMAFGDLFVLTKEPGRPVFGSISDQRRTVEVIESRYDVWHRQAASRLGDFPRPASHARMIEVVENEIPAMNSCLEGRASVRFVQNPAFVSDCSTFVP